MQQQSYLQQQNQPANLSSVNQSSTTSLHQADSALKKSNLHVSAIIHIP